MPITRLALLAALAVTLAAGSHAQTLRERMRQGVSRVQQGASGVQEGVAGVAGRMALLRKAAEVIPGDRLWVNPDCGLKTRGWSEVEPAVRNMVAAARIQRTAANARAASLAR